MKHSFQWYIFLSLTGGFLQVGASGTFCATQHDSSGAEHWPRWMISVGWEKPGWESTGIPMHWPLNVAAPCMPMKWYFLLVRWFSLKSGTGSVCWAWNLQTKKTNSLCDHKYYWFRSDWWNWIMKYFNETLLRHVHIERMKLANALYFAFYRYMLDNVNFHTEHFLHVRKCQCLWTDYRIDCARNIFVNSHCFQFRLVWTDL